MWEQFPPSRSLQTLEIIWIYKQAGKEGLLLLVPTAGPSGISGPLGSAVQKQADGSWITWEPSLANQYFRACITSHELFSVWFSVIREVPEGNKAF